MVLGGLSQGCAAALVADLMWRGEALGAVVGLCGWLPLAGRLMEVMEERSGDGDSDDDDRDGISLAEKKKMIMMIEMVVKILRKWVAQSTLIRLRYVLSSFSKMNSIFLLIFPLLHPPHPHPIPPFLRNKPPSSSPTAVSTTKFLSTWACKGETVYEHSGQRPNGWRMSAKAIGTRGRFWSDLLGFWSNAT